MKDFLEDLGERIGETAEAVTNKVGDAVEIQRLKNQIRSLEKENEKDFAEIGRMVYNSYKEGDAVDSDTSAYCEAIEDRQESIREYQSKISEVRGASKCNSCGKMVGKEMAFCPYCGEKMKADAQAASDLTDKVKEKAADAAQKAAKKADEAAQKTSDMAQKAADKVSDAADKAAQKAEEVAEKAAKKAKE